MLLNPQVMFVSVFNEFTCQVERALVSCDSENNPQVISQENPHEKQFLVVPVAQNKSYFLNKMLQLEIVVTHFLSGLDASSIACFFVYSTFLSSLFNFVSLCECA